MSKKSDKDPFLVLKNIAFHMSQPPGKVEEPTLAGFIHFARFQICEARGILFYDKLWDDYSDEQILTEYYAIRFSKDDSFRKEFEERNGPTVDDDIDWMFKQIEKNRAEIAAAGKPNELLEEFDETPQSLLEDSDDGLFDQG